MSRGSDAGALRRAAELLGGADRLAAFLAVPVYCLHNWLTGREEPPPDVLLVALDVLIDDPAGRGVEGDKRP